MIARFDAIEQFAAGSTGARRINGADPAGNRSESASHPSGSRTGCLGNPGHRTLANQPDPADLVRVARLQALIATSAVVVSETAARRGEIDAGVSDRLTPALEDAQLAWSRSARRWAGLTTPASRTDPALVPRHWSASKRDIPVCATASPVSIVPLVLPVPRFCGRMRDVSRCFLTVSAAGSYAGGCASSQARDYRPVP